MIDVFGDNPGFLELNPLGMVPALRTPEGMALFDSSAILEYLDDLSGGIWPKERVLRARIRQASTLVTGLIQATVALFQEASMHDAPSPFWVRDHFETISRARQQVLLLPRETWIREGELTQAGWDLAVAVEYLELRMKKLAMPADHPAVEEVMILARKSADFTSSTPKLN